MKTILKILFWALIFGIMSGTLAQAAVPRKILFQARLSRDGIPISGEISLRFRVYNTAAFGTGTVIAGPFDVLKDIRDGFFEAEIGDIPYNAFSASSRYLEIDLKINGGFVFLSPRVEFKSAPFAFNSNYMTGLTPEVSGARERIVKTDSSGRVAFGDAATGGFKLGYPASPIVDCAVSAGGNSIGIVAETTATESNRFGAYGSVTTATIPSGYYGRFAGVAAKTNSTVYEGIYAENTAGGPALEIINGGVFIDHCIYDSSKTIFAPRPSPDLDPIFHLDYYGNHVGPIGVGSVPIESFSRDLPPGFPTDGSLDIRYTIQNSLVTTNSLIFLTPYSPRGERRVWVKAKGAGYFTVAGSPEAGAYWYGDTTVDPVMFNFLIIN
jgi:hypothetical protein